VESPAPLALSGVWPAQELAQARRCLKLNCPWDRWAERKGKAYG
ncbi:MAG: hypothetical protein ACI9S9_004756, partial [Planctomycetota bacterium]